MSVYFLVAKTVHLHKLSSVNEKRDDSYICKGKCNKFCSKFDDSVSENNRMMTILRNNNNNKAVHAPCL